MNQNTQKEGNLNILRNDVEQMTFDNKIAGKEFVLSLLQPEVYEAVSHLTELFRNQDTANPGKRNTKLINYKSTYWPKLIKTIYIPIQFSDPIHQPKKEDSPT